MAQGWISRQLKAGRFAAIARPAALVLAVGTFLAILGPFGSGAIPWPTIWFYWVGFIAMGAVFGFGAGELIPRVFPELPEPAIYAIVPFFVAVPVTGAILWLENALSGQITLIQLAGVYGPALVISAFVTAVAYAVHRLTENRAEDRGPARPGRALTDKLPHRLRRADIHALTAEDHYLRVRTQAGEALILMRLTDAIAACEALDGARTHRSWWVARPAVRDAKKGDGRGTLILADGTEAPVSRTYYPALREAGWF
jgi:hypothetical protein